MDEKKDVTRSEVGAESPAQQETTNESKTPTKTLVTTQPNIGVGNALNSLNLFDEKGLIAAENFLTKVMRSEKGGIKSINDGLAVLMRAQDLNLPFSTCIEHIHVINGKTGVDIHIVKALLLRAACTWRCTKDYQALYEYTDGINVYIDGNLPDYTVRCTSKEEADTKLKANPNSESVFIYPVKWYSDFGGNIYRDYQLNPGLHRVVSNKAQATELAKDKKVGVYRIPNKPVDYITEYEFSRTINGKEMSSVGKFSYSDAVTADMFSKDTYKKYPRILIGHRAFTYGARDIASDVLFGVMETTELKVVANVDIEDADVIEI